MKLALILAFQCALMASVACAVAETKQKQVGKRTEDDVCDVLVPGCCAPRLLIIGAMKCGTNALMHYLNQHPALRSSWKHAEVHFFTSVGKDLHGFPDDFDHLSSAGREEYANLLVCAKPGNGLWAVDKSPSYLDDVSVAAKAHAIMPSAKVLAVLCDPAERFWKEFFHMLRFNPRYASHCPSWTSSVSRSRQMFDEHFQNRTNEYGPQVVDFPGSDLSRGLYGRRLKEWIEIYGHENVLAIDSTHDMKYQRSATLLRVLKFLGLDDHAVMARDDSLLDVYSSKHPTLHHSAWSKLHAFYAEDMKLLNDVTGVDWVSKWQKDPNREIDIIAETEALQEVCQEPSTGLGTAGDI